MQYSETALTGRSHNVAAQMTTLGKRFANAGEELLQAYHRVNELIARYPLRGLKGPVGTQQDQLDLLDGDLERLDQLEAAVARHLGFDHVLTNVGQVYPRSLDLDDQLDGVATVNTESGCLKVVDTARTTVFDPFFGGHVTQF